MSKLQKYSKKKQYRIVFLIILDAILINATSLFTVWMLANFDWDQMMAQRYVPIFVNYSMIVTVATIGVFVPFKLYNSLWEFASVDEMFHIIIAGAICTVVRFIVNRISPLDYFPVSYPLISGILMVCAVGLSRLAYRVLRSFRKAPRRAGVARTMLIGAGQAGANALQEFQKSENSANEVVAIIDDDRSKHGKYLKDVKIYGGREKIKQIAEEKHIDEIVFAIPSASASDRREILTICQQTKCSLKTLPGIFQLANGDVRVQRIRRVDVSDLLGRDCVNVDLAGIAGYIRGKTVLITGGGGSIGSELCRQIAKNQPKQLIIYEFYENNAYEIQQELKRSAPELSLEVAIGSVRDNDRLEAVFSEYHPDIVFHAAAHKHVPLMESSPNEAIKNNVFGTLNTVKAADKYHAGRFVLISTDKAVNPTSIMGASKRICEMIVQIMSKESSTVFAAVRFGNVLESNGSVIPLFRKQIEAGGPVTVTHKDIIRYFMTIPEAVSLVLQAGAFAKQGEIFVLDMGEPVRIDDLARKMIRLSGFEPDVDIKIEYVGLRPGEKLYEEMLMQDEQLRKTDNEMIYIARPLVFDEEKFRMQLQRLRESCSHNDDNIQPLVSEIVETYSFQPKQPQEAAPQQGKAE